MPLRTAWWRERHGSDKHRHHLPQHSYSKIRQPLISYPIRKHYIENQEKGADR
jgi:hypothetical protein